LKDIKNLNKFTQQEENSNERGQLTSLYSW